MPGLDDALDFPSAPGPAAERLAVWRFDSAKSRWIDQAAPVCDTPLSTLSCATFNTWFQGPEPDLRYGGLLETLQRAEADAIMLQEVTVRLLDLIRSSAWIRARYQLIHAPIRIDAIPSHGVALLTRLPVSAATLHPLPTHMGRRLLVAELRVNGAAFVFATAHLESMKPYADVRGEQLKTIFGIIGPARHAVLAGDFNFCSSWSEENNRIDPGYVDVWPALRPAEPGYTQDTDVNLMLALAKQETKKVRFDRILLRSAAGKGCWAAQSVRLLGTEPVSPRYPKIFPSDHFGLSATLRPEGQG